MSLWDHLTYKTIFKGRYLSWLAQNYLLWKTTCHVRPVFCPMGCSYITDFIMYMDISTFYTGGVLTFNHLEHNIGTSAQTGMPYFTLAIAKLGTKGFNIENLFSSCFCSCVLEKMVSFYLLQKSSPQNTELPYAHVCLCFPMYSTWDHL